LERTVIEVGALVLDSMHVYNGPAYLAWEEGRIVEVGKGVYQDHSGPPVKRLAKPRSLAMPGLVNAHGHAAMTLLRGAGDDMPLMNWLNERIFPLEAKLGAEAVYTGTLLACWEMLRSGTTFYTDMYMFMESAAKAVSEAGMRALLSSGAVGFDEQSRLRGLERTTELVKAWEGGNNGRIRTSVGPHAPYTCPPDYLHRLAGLADELSVPLQIHLSETRVEVENSYAEFGKSPILHAADCGVFDVPTLAAHCVHVDEQDIEILAANNVHVAHNPQSNLKLGSGIAPLQALLSKNICVGLGTDGAASNNNLDMFEELRLASTLHKGVLEDATAIPAAKALYLATEGSALSCFRESGAGTLNIGREADFILVNLDSPHMTPRFDLISNLVYACGSDDVTDVFIAGEHVLSGGVPTRFDHERVLYDARRIAASFGVSLNQNEA
jgi:5-methylthioadenosine/S-adenosylhomocysteine deaminase